MFFHVAAQSFPASFSLFSWPLFFQLRLLTQHPLVGSTPASEGTGRVQSVKIDRTENSVAPETAEHLQPLLNDLLAVSLVTGKRKMWRKLSVRWEKREKGRSGCQLGKALDERAQKMSPASLCEMTETWCSLIADLLAQNKPVVSSRHQNKQLKRIERQPDRQLQPL